MRPLSPLASLAAINMRLPPAAIPQKFTAKSNNGRNAQENKGTKEPGCKNPPAYQECRSCCFVLPITGKETLRSVIKLLGFLLSKQLTRHFKAACSLRLCSAAAKASCPPREGGLLLLQPSPRNNNSSPIRMQLSLGCTLEGQRGVEFL